MKKNLIKMPFTAMLALICAMFFVIATSCAQGHKTDAYDDDEDDDLEELMAQVRIANRECPVSLGDMGSMESVKFSSSNNSIVYTIKLSDAYAQLFDIEKDILKEMMRVSLIKELDDDFIEEVVDAGVGLDMVFENELGTRKVTLHMSAKELKKAANTPMTTEEISQSQLNNLLAKENSLCPQNVDTGLNITKVVREGNYVNYYCEADEDYYDISAIKNAESSVKDAILEYFRTAVNNDDIDIIVANNLGIKYTYVGSRSGKKCVITFSVRELETTI